MIHIELYIKINESPDAYKCDVLESDGIWKAMLYQRDFIYTSIEEPTIWKCLESLARKIYSLGEVDEIQGNTKEVYIAIVKGHLLQLAAEDSTEGELFA